MISRRATIFFVGISVSAFLLWFATRNTEVSTIVRHLREVHLLAAVPFVVTLLIFFWLRAYRWKLLLSPISAVGTGELFGPMMIGYGANFLLPFQLGEVARSVAAREKAKLPVMPIAFSIVVERVFDYLVIIAALALSLVMHKELPAYVTNLGVAGGIFVVMLIGLIAVFTMKTRRSLEIVKRLLTFAPGRIQEAVLRQLELGAGGLQSIRDARLLTLTAAASIAQWVLLALCIWIALSAVELQVPVQTVLLVMALMVLAISIPNAPAYIGSVQAAYVIGVEAIGGDAAQALSASIFHHVSFGTTSMILGSIALLQTRLRWRQLKSTDAEL